MIVIHNRLHDRPKLDQSFVVLEEHWVVQLVSLILWDKQVPPNVLSNKGSIVVSLFIYLFYLFLIVSIHITLRFIKKNIINEQHQHT